MSETQKSFFATLPGVLTGLAAVVTAAATFYVTVLKEDPKETNTTSVIPTRPIKVPDAETSKSKVTKKQETRRVPYQLVIDNLKCSGDDCDMGSRDGHYLTVVFSSRLYQKGSAVRLEAYVDAHEQPGKKATRLWKRVDVEVFPALPGKRIVKIDAPGGLTFGPKEQTKDGLHYDYKDFSQDLLSRSYWTSIQYKIDAKSDKDQNYATVRGILNFSVVLEDET